MVDDTKASEERNVDRHVVLGDRVHGGRDKGSLQGDALRDWSIEGNLGRGEACGRVRMLRLHGQSAKKKFLAGRVGLGWQNYEANAPM